MALQRRNPGSVTIVIRPPGRPPYAVTLGRLADHVQAAAELKSMVSRDELKKKRQQAMGVVGTERQATADMYDRVIAEGQKVRDARAAAEDAHMSDLQGQVRDLQEDFEDLQEFGQSAANPPKLPADTAKSAGATTKPAIGSAALAALNAAQPNIDSSKWVDGDAYHETHPEPGKSAE